MKTHDFSIEPMIADAIKRVQTNAHIIKEVAGSLRDNGFDGVEMGELRKLAESLIKSVHEYQSYNNVKNNQDKL